MILIAPGLRIDDTDLCVWAEGESCPEPATIHPKWVTPEGRIVPLRWGTNDKNGGPPLRFCGEHLVMFLAFQQTFADAVDNEQLKWALASTRRKMGLV